MYPNKLPLEPRHLGVPSDASKMISEPMVRVAQTMHLSSVYIITITKWTQTSFHLRLITYRYHWVLPKQFMSRWYLWRKSWPILHWHKQCLQTDHNKIPHDRSHLGVPSGVSKWFSSLWYVWHKQCTYLASRLALCLNGWEWTSNWASSPRSTIGCIQNDF
jgi:hypothetical protein